jgi:hypothetical protein
MNAQFLKMVSKATEAQLVNMNREIVFALRERRTESAMSQMTKFRRGMKVEFEGRRGETIRGTIENCNFKTVSVKVPGERGWRVHPSFLKVVR